MIKSKKINIIKNSIRTKNFKKQEINKKILKSMIQNKNIKPIIRSSIYYKKSFFKKKQSISKINNVCLYSGKIKSIFNVYKMSRHFVKKFFNENELQNNKLINW